MIKYITKKIFSLNLVIRKVPWEQKKEEKPIKKSMSLTLIVEKLLNLDKKKMKLNLLINYKMMILD